MAGWGRSLVGRASPGRPGARATSRWSGSRSAFRRCGCWPAAPPARPRAARARAVVLRSALARSYARAAPRSGSRRSPTRRPRARLTWSAARPARRWRGRYPGAGANSTPMSVIRTPVPATRSTGSVASCTSGKRRRRRARPGEARAAVTTRRSSAQAGARRERRQREGPADEAHDRLATPERGRGSGNACPSIAPATAGPGGPPAADRQPAGAGNERLPRRRRANAGHARRAPSCSRAFQAPGLPSAVRRRSTPWRRATSSATGNGPEQVAAASAAATYSKGAVASFHLVRYPRDMRRRPVGHGPRPAQLRARRPAVLAAARHGPRRTMTAPPTCAAGPCSRSGRRRGARRVPGGSPVAARWRGVARRATPSPRAAARHGALGRTQAVDGAADAGAATGPSPSSRAPRSGRAGPPSTARSPPGTRTLGAPGLLASVGDRRGPRAAPGHVLPLAQTSRTCGVRLRGARAPEVVRRTREEAGTARSLRPLPPTARSGTWDGRDPLAQRARSRRDGAAAERHQRQPAAGVHRAAGEPQPVHAADPCRPAQRPEPAVRAPRRRWRRRRRRSRARGRRASAERGSTMRARTPSRSIERRASASQSARGRPAR